MPLPLPLVPFEEYMLADDRPAYPMRFLLKLRFSGRFDRPALETAFAAAARRHPLLTARLESRGKRLYWVAACASLSPVRWLSQAPGEDSQAMETIDLRARPALQAWAWEEGDSSELIVQMHHATSDGKGAFRFVEDLLLFYDAACQGDVDKAKLGPLDAQQLRTRGRFGLTAWKLLKMVPAQLTGLVGAFDFMRHKVLPLGLATSAAEWTRPSNTFPAALESQLSAEVSAAYRAAAKRANATPNDCLARDLFLAIGDWCERHPTQPREGWWRLSIPMNLRWNDGRQLPAANVVSMVFLDRQASDLRDPESLLTGIHDQMDRIKRRKLGLTFVFSLSLLKALPRGIAQATRPDRCAATCVLTNVGAPLDHVALRRSAGRLVAGEVTLQSIHVIAPLRPHTSAAISVIRYADQMSITLSYDPLVLSRDQAQALFDSFLKRVRHR